MTILELAHQKGLSPKRVASTNGGEYHSACPSCGGTDRFFMQPFKQMNNCLGSYCCRQCGVSGNAINFAREFLNLSFQDAVQAVGAMIPELLKPSTWSMSYAHRPATLQKPNAKWIEMATEFVHHAHENLLHNNAALNYLAKRGLPLDAVLRYKLGWSYQQEFLSRIDWGLPEELKENGMPRKLWLPKGLVIPTIESNNVLRIKIRRSNYQEGDKHPKYVAISGSMNGLNLIGFAQQNTMIVVESELDAYAIDFVARDLVCTVGVGSNIKNPDNVTDRLAKNMKTLLICHDVDGAAGLKMLNKWQKLYKQAQACPTPIGKDIGEAIEQGLDLRSWINSKIENKG